MKSESSTFHLDFLVIGSRKCATTWLYQLFLAHPEISVSRKVKESGFFSRYFHRGIGWYSSLFDRSPYNVLTGEIDPANLSSSEAPSRIHALYPECKILMIFRNPPDMFFSSYEHALRKGDTLLPPQRAWRELPRFHEELRYGTMLKNYLDYFHPGQIFVVFYEDIVKDSYSILEQIKSFLGLETSFDLDIIHARVNPSRSPNSQMFSHLLVRMARIARQLDLHFLVNMTKRIYRVKHHHLVLPREKVEQGRRGEIRNHIIDEMGDEIRLFRNLTGLDVASCWPETAYLLGPMNDEHV